MTRAEVDDWYALLTARTGDIRRSRQTSARLAALEDPEILSGVASRMIRQNARSCWYIAPICDRLPAGSLRHLAAEAARARGDGGNEAADKVIAYVSVHQPGALTAPAGIVGHQAQPPVLLRELAVAGGRRRRDHPAAQGSQRCQRAGREVRGPLPDPDPPPGDPGPAAGGNDHLAMAGFERDGDGELRRLHATAVWHLAFPPQILQQWAAQRPLRRRQPSWPASTGSGQQHVTSGFLDQTCPACGQRLHRLLRLDPVPPGIGITSRERLEFAWCPLCGMFTGTRYARHAPDGTPEPFPARRGSGPDHEPEPFEDWLIPQTPVELVRLGERWRQQDWGLANDRENLHRAGGEPTWIQDAGYPACPGCPQTMSAAGQITVEDLWNAEGICYLLWCEPCAISAIVYQQT